MSYVDIRTGVEGFLVDMCAGSGMLGLAVKCACGWNRVQTIAYVERESYAAATLVARMAEKALDRAPIWDDVTTTTDDDFVAHVTRFRPLILTAGYPCQPFSLAGKRLGARDPRHLWPAIARFVKRVRPEVCFFENVPGHMRLGFDQVYQDLRGMGYAVDAGIFSAEEVGADPERKRLFILAVAGAAGKSDCAERRTESRERARIEEEHRPVPSARGAKVAGSGHVPGGSDSDGVDREPTDASTGAASGALDGTTRNGLVQCGIHSRSRRSGETAGLVMRPGTALGSAEDVERRSREPGDAVGTGEIRGGGSTEPSQALVGTDGERELESDYETWAESQIQSRRAARGPGVRLFAPAPDDGAWRNILWKRPELRPAVEPEVYGVPDGVAYRLDSGELRLTGEGVVPLAAAYAFVSLWASLCGGGPGLTTEDTEAHRERTAS